MSPANLRVNDCNITKQSPDQEMDGVTKNYLDLGCGAGSEVAIPLRTGSCSLK